MDKQKVELTALDDILHYYRVSQFTGNIRIGIEQLCIVSIQEFNKLSDVIESSKQERELITSLKDVAYADNGIVYGSIILSYRLGSLINYEVTKSYNSMELIKAVARFKKCKSVKIVVKK